MGCYRSLHTNNSDKIKHSTCTKEKIVSNLPNFVPEKDIHTFRILPTQSSNNYKFMTVNDPFTYRIHNCIYHRDSISEDLYTLHVIDENTT